MADYKAKVTWYADARNLLAGTKKVGSSLDAIGRKLEQHSTKLLMAGGALAGAIGGLVKQGIDYGTTVDKIAEVSGVAHEQVSRLAYSAELYHGNADALLKTLRPLANAMAEAADGSAEYADEFERAGVAVVDGTGNLRDLDDILLDVADYMSSGANETEKLAFATKTLGRGAMELLPWLKQGRDELARNFVEAERLGRVLDSDTAKALEATGTAVKDVKLALGGLATDVAIIVSPAIQDLATDAKDAVASFQDLAPSAQRAAVELAGLGVAGLLGLGAIGKMAPILGTATGPLGAFALIVGGLAAEFIALEAAADSAIEKLKTVPDAQMKAQAQSAGWWGGLLAGATGAMQLIAPGFGMERYGNMPQMQGPPVPSDLAESAGGGGGGGNGGGAPGGFNAAWLEQYADAYTVAEGAGIRFGDSISGVTSSLTAQDNAIDLSVSKWDEWATAIRDNALPVLYEFMGGLDAFVDDGIDRQLKGFDVMKDATRSFLREQLRAWAKAELMKLVGIEASESGAALMTGQLWRLPIIAAGYAAASAGINKLTSFGTSAVIKQGGILTGQFEPDDRIISPTDWGRIQTALAGGGTGRGAVNVTIYVNGSEGGASQSLRDSGRWLADLIASKVQR